MGKLIKIMGHCYLNLNRVIILFSLMRLLVFVKADYHYILRLLLLNARDPILELTTDSLWLMNSVVNANSY